MTTLARILLIDDDAVDRASVRRALKASNLTHELVEASDGTSGLAAARAERFDCVLLDFRLPDVDTFELLAALISPEGGNQAVMMLTGESDQDVALRLMRAGALDYLTKADTNPPGLARAIRYAKARRAFLAELETAREEAEEKSRALDLLNRQKTLLFSIIAHDLRNPFQALLGLSQTLSQAVATKDPASVELRAQGIGEAAKRAHALMESLFSWASLQMDSSAIELVQIDLGDVARDALSTWQQRANEKNLVLKSACDGFFVRGHRDMLAAVLRNLVGNAVKFTDSGGSVVISAARRGTGVAIEVSDTGVGMSADNLAELFQLDRRMTTLGTAGERGSGLGLLFCRDLVERQGGELTVSSETGRGTTFAFTLPET